jgi:hypothetical protein
MLLFDEDARLTIQKREAHNDRSQEETDNEEQVRVINLNYYQYQK